MYAIIATGGKQYKVAKDDVLDIEILGSDVGSTVEFTEVLACGEGDALKVGSPLVEGAKVEAEVLNNFRGDKLIAFKMKKRKGYRRKKGHRQSLTQIKITAINAG